MQRTIVVWCWSVESVHVGYHRSRRLTLPLVTIDCHPPSVGQHRSVLQDDVQRVDNTRNVAQDGQEDVDQKICAAAALEEDAERWE